MAISPEPNIKDRLDEMILCDVVCPRCGAGESDSLVWKLSDGEEVECATCGLVYTPSAS